MPMYIDFDDYPPYTGAISDLKNLKLIPNKSTFTDFSCPIQETKGWYGLTRKVDKC